MKGINLIIIGKQYMNYIKKLFLWIKRCLILLNCEVLLKITEQGGAHLFLGNLTRIKQRHFEKVYAPPENQFFPLAKDTTVHLPTNSFENVWVRKKDYYSINSDISFNRTIISLLTMYLNIKHWKYHPLKKQPGKHFVGPKLWD